MKNILIKKAPITIQFYFKDSIPNCLVTTNLNKTEAWDSYSADVQGFSLANNDTTLDEFDHDMLAKFMCSYLLQRARK